MNEVNKIMKFLEERKGIMKERLKEQIEKRRIYGTFDSAYLLETRTRIQEITFISDHIDHFYVDK